VTGSCFVYAICYWRSAVIYSILISRSVNPLEYLTDVLGKLPGAKISDIQDLLPTNWKPPPVTSGQTSRITSCVIRDQL
jgi:uncharacterized membrane protein